MAQNKKASRIAEGRFFGYPKSKPKGDSITTGYTVGQDNVTGKPIISDGGGSTIKGQSGTDPKPMKKATARRDNVSRGGRDVTIDTTNISMSSGGRDKPGVKSKKKGGLTPGLAKDDTIDPCKPGQDNIGDENVETEPEDGDGGLGRANTPEPPLNPTIDPFGGIDGPRLGGTNTSGSGGSGGGSGGSSTTWNDPPPSDDGDGNDPETLRNPGSPDNGGPDPASNNPPRGCSPDDDCQWYNGTGCPTGTSSRGSAELGDGSKMELCCGSDRPPGDGCPDDETSAGYECRDRECHRVPGGGIYSTLDECEQDCGSQGDDKELPPLGTTRWECVDGSCVEAEDGPFESKSDCLQTGCEMPDLSQNKTYQVTATEPGDCGGFEKSCGNTFISNCVRSGGFLFGPATCGYVCGSGEVWDGTTSCTFCNDNDEKVLIEGKVIGSGTPQQVTKNVNGPIDRFEVQTSHDGEDNDCSIRLVAILENGSTVGIASVCGSTNDGTECANSNKGIGYFSPQVVIID